MGNTKSGKAKGRTRRCRRCKQDYQPDFTLQKVCDACRQVCSVCSIKLTQENSDKRSWESKKKFQCKSCVAKSVREVPNRQEWQKAYDLKRKYDIDLVTFSKLARHGCALCGSNQKLVVDHCHKTNKVRGVLCSNCNLGIGLLKDNKDTMMNAINYV